MGFSEPGEQIGCSQNGNRVGNPIGDILIRSTLQAIDFNLSSQLLTRYTIPSQVGRHVYTGAR